MSQLPVPIIASILGNNVDDGAGGSPARAGRRHAAVFRGPRNRIFVTHGCRMLNIGAPPPLARSGLPANGSGAQAEQDVILIRQAP